MRISDWSSDVCSSDLRRLRGFLGLDRQLAFKHVTGDRLVVPVDVPFLGDRQGDWLHLVLGLVCLVEVGLWKLDLDLVRHQWCRDHEDDRSEEHTSELQSLMRISYAVFCLQKKKSRTRHQT